MMGISDKAPEWQELDEYHRLFAEMAYLAFLVNQRTEYCVFFDFSGHVHSLRIDVTSSKLAYNDKIASADFYVDKWDGTSLGWFKQKRDVLAKILENEEIPTEGTERVLEYVESYRF